MNTPDDGTEASSRDRPARQIVRRLINSGRFEGPDGDTSAYAAAGDHLYRELSRWVGPDGCDALFTRALAEARDEHAPLGQIKLCAGSDPYIGGIAETVVAYGDAATAKALEWMLVHLVGLVSRLIGDDMTTKLIERSPFTSERANPGHSKREKA
jgi:hypothetical protein